MFSHFLPDCANSVEYICSCQQGVRNGAGLTQSEGPRGGRGRWPHQRRGEEEVERGGPQLKHGDQDRVRQLRGRRGNVNNENNVNNFFLRLP